MMPTDHIHKLDAGYLDFRNILHIFVGKKWLIILITLTTFMIAMAYAVFSPNTYQATVLLEVHHKQESSLGSLENASVGNSSEEPISLQMALIRSKFILEPVIQSIHLQEELQKPKSEIINDIIKHLIIYDLSGTAENAASKAGILKLTLTGQDPDKIIRIINKIALVTQEKDKERKSLEAKKTLEFLYQQLPILQASLKEAEAKLNEYRSTSGKIDIKLQTEYLLTHLADINKQLENILLKKMDMSQQYTQHHPFMINLNQKIKGLQTEKADLLNQIKNLPAADQEASSLKRDVKVKNDLYMLLLNKIHEQQVITAGIVSDIAILSLATYPDKPLILNFFLIGCVSLFVGLIFAGMVILIWEMLNQRVRHPHLAEQKFNLKNFIILPFSKTQTKNSSLFKNKKIHLLPLLTHHYYHDSVTDSLRFLQIIIENNSKSLKNNIVSVMGISRHVGKSFIAANLAILLSRMNQHILLIDADLRGGHLHDYFSNKATPGLTDVLNKNITLAQAKIIGDNSQYLHFLPAGTSVSHPTDLLMSSLFKELLHDLAHEYQYIIVSCAPILSVTDATIVGKIAGSNILVIGENKHESWEINMAIRNLSNAGVTLHSSIFNCLKPGKLNQQYHSEVR